MTREELPFLNLDAATSLYLPLEPIEARAHYRFAFRLPSGDEEWLLARLCVGDSPDSDGKSLYVVVLRPEKAENCRIFVVNNFEYRSGKRKIEHIMTLAAAKKFKWDLFAQSFSDEENQLGLFRLWHVNEKERTTLLELSAGSGNISSIVSEEENSIGECYDGSFSWRRIPFGQDNRVKCLKFLRLKDVSFKRKLRSLWNDENSELRYVLRWIDLSDTQRDAIAFECKNGEWKELRGIAKLVLQLRVSTLKTIPQSNFTWSFFGYGYIFVRWISELDEDDTLLLWRLALTYVFQTTNFDINGLKEDLLPYVLKNYIFLHDQGKIEASPPSMHDILEATLKLEAWTKAHFSTENAQILMNSLQNFSESDARKLFESLT